MIRSGSQKKARQRSEAGGVDAWIGLVQLTRHWIRSQKGEPPEQTGGRIGRLYDRMDRLDRTGKNAETDKGFLAPQQRTPLTGQT